jgi:hypothetical protein
MQNFAPLSQYLCSKCGSILKETSADVQISSVREDCPSCGTILSESLTKRSRVEPRLQLLKPQTAYDLFRFGFDIEKIDSFMKLGTEGSLCVVGYKSNLILARLCVRALLPAKYGGLDSPYVVIVDAGNKSDIYQMVNFAMQYGMDIEKVIDRILINRAFTIYELNRLLSVQLPKLMQKYQTQIVIIPGLLDTLDENPNMKENEAKKEIGIIMKTIVGISRTALVVTSLQHGKYVNSVTGDVQKRINLLNSKHGITAELYNHGKRRRLTLKERELKVITKGDRL